MEIIGGEGVVDFWDLLQKCEREGFGIIQLDIYGVLEEKFGLQLQILKFLDLGGSESEVESIIKEKNVEWEKKDLGIEFWKVLVNKRD